MEKRCTRVITTLDEYIQSRQFAQRDFKGALCLKQAVKITSLQLDSEYNEILKYYKTLL